MAQDKAKEEEVKDEEPEPEAEDPEDEAPMRGVMQDIEDAELHEEALRKMGKNQFTLLVLKLIRVRRGAHVVGR